MSTGYPRINVYRCEYGCNTSTVDVDDGVTPFMIQCRSRARPDRPLDPKYTGPDGFCIGTAQSSFYPKGPKPPHIRDPEWEWYKPTTTEGLSDGERAHVERGGLLLRGRTDRAPIFHPEDNKPSQPDQPASPVTAAGMNRQERRTALAQARRRT